MCGAAKPSTRLPAASKTRGIIVAAKYVKTDRFFKLLSTHDEIYLLCFTVSTQKIITAVIYRAV